MNWIALAYWVLGVGVPIALLVRALVVLWQWHPAPSTPSSVVLLGQDDPPLEWKYNEALLHMQTVSIILGLDPGAVSVDAIAACLQQAQQAYVPTCEATIAQQLQVLHARETDRIHRERLREQQLLDEVDFFLQRREQPRYGGNIPASTMLLARTSAAALRRVEFVS